MRRDARKGATNEWPPLNSGGCTRAFIEGVRRLCDGLPPPEAVLFRQSIATETSMMQPLTAQVWYARGPGENPFYFPPGGFRFLSPRRKEHVTEPCSLKKRTHPHNMRQLPAGSLSLPPLAESSSLPEGALCTLMQLYFTACGELLPSSTKADATSLREGGSAPSHRLPLAQGSLSLAFPVATGSLMTDFLITFQQIFA